MPEFKFDKKSLLIAVFLAGCVFLLLFSTRALFLTGDSINYALSAKNGSSLFHPHHLLYNLSIRNFFLLLNKLSMATDIILAAQIHNIFFSTISVLSIFFIIKKLTSSYVLSVLAGMSLLFSLGFWRLSTQIETYIPSLAFLSLMMLTISSKDRMLNTNQLLMIAFLQVLAVLYHQMNILFFIPLIIYFFTFQRNKTKKALIIAVFLPWV
ncbi:MAG: DUF2723 domain-containing protein, partial [Candidatus Omnitrophica bacterium]|nr:DUF2723 domain-containing protein [Candidatus Omnitrophota bacterium]